MVLEYTSRLPAKEQLLTFYEKLDWNRFLNLSAEQLLQAMEQSWCCLFVYEEGQLIATGRIVSDGVINGYLCGVGVLESHRQQGIGRELCKRLVAGAKAQGLHLQLFCEEPLVPYYESMGFHPFAVGLKLD